MGADEEPTPELKPTHCFEESAKALRKGKLAKADRWRQLGEAISAANQRAES